MTNYHFKKITTLLITAVFSTCAFADADGITSGDALQAAAEKVTTDINTEKLKKRLDVEPDLMLIDIRMPSEIERMGGGIDSPQNINIPRGWLEFRITNAATEKDTPIVVYCGGNIRSPLAAQTLQQMGYTNVRNYSDGFLGWRKAGLPVSE